jgi:hypothetical protein
MITQMIQKPLTMRFDTIISFLVNHDEILKKISKSEKKFLTTTKQFLGPLLTNERSKTKPYKCRKKLALNIKF